MLPILHLAATAALTGLIWVIQLVKYPGFRYLSKENFVKYHEHHTQSIIWIVLPLMTSELGLVGWLAWQNDFGWQTLVPLLLIIGIWLSTFTLQIPMHNILSEKKDDRAIEILIRTNWIRTILWTTEVGWLIYFAV